MLSGIVELGILETRVIRTRDGFFCLRPSWLAEENMRVETGHMQAGRWRARRN